MSETPYSFVIVLGHTLLRNGYPGKESRLRTLLACSFIRNKLASKALFSGWSYRSNVDVSLAKSMKFYAVSTLGLPFNKGLTEERSKDTVGDAFYTYKKILKYSSNKKIAVITSDYHIKRAGYIFKFIYGPSFHIDIYGVATSNSVKKVFSERRSLSIFKKTFKDVNPGEISGIQKVLKNRHPYYANIRAN